MKRILLTLLVLMSLPVAAQEAVLLRINYNEGDTYMVKVETKTNMGLSGFMNTYMNMNMNVTAIEDGLFRTESQLTYVKMDMEQGGMSMQYDTDMKADELDDMGQMMKSQFDPMMKATIYTAIDKFGTNVETKIEPAIAGMEQLTQGTGVINYPTEKVSVGTSWTSEAERQGMNMKITYTVQNISDGIANLDISGELSGVGTGTITGTTNIDLKSGVQTNSELQLTVTAQGIEVSTNVKTVMTKV